MLCNCCVVAPQRNKGINSATVAIALSSFMLLVCLLFLGPLAGAVGTKIAIPRTVDNRKKTFAACTRIGKSRPKRSV